MPEDSRPKALYFAVFLYFFLATQTPIFQTEEPAGERSSKVYQSLGPRLRMKIDSDILHTLPKYILQKVNSVRHLVLIFDPMQSPVSRLFRNGATY